MVLHLQILILLDIKQNKGRDCGRKKCSKQSRENLILDPIMTLEESIESHVRIIYINNNEDCGVGEDVVRFCTPGAKWLNLMLLGHMQIITEN